MNAKSLLVEVASGLNEVGLEAILIGNAAGALHGAPVTTMDLDFMFRKTPTNINKLKKLSEIFSATILRPYYPVSSLYRLSNDERGIILDFMPVIHGVKSFASLRSRAEKVSFGNFDILLASLEDVIKSKKAAGRLRDKASLPILETTLYEKNKFKKNR